MGGAAGSTVGKTQNYLKTYLHKMPRPGKRREGQTSQKGVVCRGSVALGQSSITRWSLGEKRGETGGTGTARGNVCVWAGGRCKTEYHREVWVPASSGEPSGSTVQRGVGWRVGTEQGPLVHAVGF